MKKLFLLAGALFLAACGTNNESQAQSGSTAGANGSTSGSIIVAGSTTVTPLMTALVTSFNEVHPDINIEVQELGTSAGINATIDGVSDIAMSSRLLTAEEQERGLNPTLIALDGMGVIVHPDNPITDISTYQIRDIFRGYITNWSEVGGDDALITVVSREAGSGARVSFESFTGVYDEVEVGESTVQASAVSPMAVISSGTGGVLASVSGNRYAIGYLTTGVNPDTIKHLSIDGVSFSTSAVLDGSFPFANSFFLGTRDDVNETAQYFVNWILSPAGQQAVVDAEFVPAN
jgi:phosphate transport system substrate-binding protein